MRRRGNWGLPQPFRKPSLEAVGAINGYAVVLA
ncbi:hypothetical protein P9067_07350 [Gallibacterium anatis]